MSDRGPWRIISPIGFVDAVRLGGDDGVSHEIPLAYPPQPGPSPNPWTNNWTRFGDTLSPIRSTAVDDQMTSPNPLRAPGARHYRDRVDDWEDTALFVLLLCSGALIAFPTLRDVVPVLVPSAVFIVAAAISFHNLRRRGLLHLNISESARQAPRMPLWHVVTWVLFAALQMVY